MVHNNVGMIYQRLGRTEAALAAFQRALRADPGFIRATLNLGTLYVRLGRHEDAIRLYEGALADQGDQPLLHANLAHVLHLVGRRDEAEAHWQRAMQLAPRLEELRRAPDTRVAGGSRSARRRGRLASGQSGWLQSPDRHGDEAEQPGSGCVGCGVPL
jgi:tetratricopeptide (TPR) repeat protein